MSSIIVKSIDNFTPFIQDCTAIKTPDSADSNSRCHFFLVELIYPSSLILIQNILNKFNTA